MVELRLTEQGRALHEKAKVVPACILAATERSIEQLDSLRHELVSLRGSLGKAVS
ncbi:hypothetical protein D3C84_1181700 [compost metagenome]